MEIMKNHADLLREIDVIKGQIEQLEISVMYWMGNKGQSYLVLTGEGARIHGLGIASENVDRIHKRINALQMMLEAFESIRDENEKRINQFTGVSYAIARMRFIEGKDYQEIAGELGLTYGYIRQIVSKSNKERTAILEKA